ncbi:daunorubicin resistance protein DrrA family ABC transporter ATP-binding protein [Pseudonocardia sulfidoxydans NBRC 16205]|uniref:Daunorubicin resistance protein DrrA family ABC transporter ATP-binding protein n=1 Tax=Pseudonocardia sulfidoxydans NBRC 16205 TaxID=1223511 RepID=A0A511DMX8_9PSEU|nr:ATP-binding cassette domain-containing protein [Pseudonocardia sulfidoxydans]GEL26175.1 daunorubicin resistance protein DrrA family ABC transporter ATP-binding protein [Pseudonocardia sulfidoxydans NBRC 16205]
MESTAVRVEGLTKSFGATRALDGVDLEIPAGTILGLLGPNGAGKTTTVRILTTLLRPDAGRAVVAGYDVVEQPQQVRRAIGLSGQYAAVDENLTGSENLYLVGRLYGLSRKAARSRATELLARFKLTEAAERPSKTYSGGMRRRLDLAGALVSAPQVVVLDEPTTGLDPRGRLDTWSMISELVADGATVLLTTQYLEEADQLADRIVVIDRGRAIAAGTADELKSQVGGERLQVVVSRPEHLPFAQQVLADVGIAEPQVEEHVRRVAAPVSGGTKALVEAVRRFDAEGVELLDVGLQRPTLDDVFLQLTGHLAEEETVEEPKKGRRSRRKDKNEGESA